jgi:hypothetical protein
MPAPLNVDKEAVRVLVVAVGVRETARRMNLSENTVLGWSKQGAWLKQPDPIPLPPTVQSRTINTIKPADALAAVLQSRSNKTKLHLSKYTLEASKTAARSKGDLKLAKAVKEVAGTASMVHSWQEKEQGSGPLNLNLLGGRAVIQINQGQRQD